MPEHPLVLIRDIFLESHLFLPSVCSASPLAGQFGPHMLKFPQQSFAVHKAVEGGFAVADKT